jgi:hypothetical protein
MISLWFFRVSCGCRGGCGLWGDEDVETDHTEDDHNEVDEVLTDTGAVSFSAEGG